MMDAWMHRLLHEAQQVTHLEHHDTPVECVSCGEMTTATDRDTRCGECVSEQESQEQGEHE